MRPTVILCVLTTLALLLTACPAPSSTTGTTGTLKVTVTGLPSGVDADVTVNGPGIDSEAVTGSITFNGIATGSYTVSAAAITSTAVTAEYRPTITPASIEVVADQTASVSVEYAVVAGSLSVSVSGLPVGLDADVSIVGPNGFTRDLTADTVLTELEPGVYSASADSVADGSDSYSVTLSGSPAEVSSSTGAVIEVTYALDPGSLELTISGLPSGVDGDVTVAGANGFSQTVSASTTLTGLVPGIYTLTVAPVVTDDPVVSEAYDLSAASPASVEVISNATAGAGATYGKRPGTGRLWRPLTGDPLLEGYTAAQLATSGAPTAAVVLTETGGATDEVVAFDGEGNAWVTNLSSNTVRRYDAARLATTATATPDVTLASDGTSLNSPLGLAFDGSGNLWVASAGGSRLEMFTPAQLATSGSPTPAVIIGSDGTSLDGPYDFAFDAAGNLWVVTLGSEQLEKFAPAQLATSGTPTPEVVLASDGTSLDLTYDLAFDAAGNLWLTSGTLDRLEMFTPAQLATSGSPTPAVIIDSDGTSLSVPSALAFDNGGNLWVNSTLSETVEKFTPAQLASSGAPTPAVSITTGTASDLGGIAFSPPPSDLPIHAP